MARARNIKPSIMDNDQLAELQPLTRLLFVYMWMLADKLGRLEDRPKRIAAKALPYERGADVDAMLTDLQRAGFIERYEVEGQDCIQILAFTKHQTPHVREADSELPSPEQGTTKALPEHNLGSASPKQGNDEPSPRSPDTGYRIPDTGLSDTPLLIACLAAQPAAELPAKAQAKPKLPSPTAYVWEAYSTAYFNRYGSEPVRNAKVNGQLAQLVSRIGEQEAPSVASFYVGHQDRYYVHNMHTVDSLLRDAEKLRTEWATNRRMTATKAHQADKTATNYGAFQGLIDKAMAEEEANGKH